MQVVKSMWYLNSGYGSHRHLLDPLFFKLKDSGIDVILVVNAREVKNIAEKKDG